MRSQRTPSVRYLDDCNGRIPGCSSETLRRISDDGPCSLSERLGNVTITIRRAPAKGDKERAFAYSPRIILNARNHRVGSGAPYEVDTGQNAIEIHRAAHP